MRKVGESHLQILFGVLFLVTLEIRSIFLDYPMAALHKTIVFVIIGNNIAATSN